MLTLTAPAAAKVKSLIEQEGDTSLALRVAVKPGALEPRALSLS